MRILLNDFSGHAFPIQLSRELAMRGHTVLHTWCSSFLTPHGRLAKQAADPATLSFAEISLGREINKRGLASRWFQEREVGRRYVKIAGGFAPEVIVSANMPLGAQGKLLGWARRCRVPFVFWMQDVYGVGATANLRKRIPLLGAWLGRAFSVYERVLLKRSSHVIVITEDFLPYVPARIRQPQTTVIENWAPLGELPVLPKDNAWSREHGLADKLCFLYAGTLGMKHNPELLLALAAGLRERRQAVVVVISEGQGAEYLKAEKQSRGLDNLELMDFQPFGRMAEVHASADILVAILEKDAGVFAVPSKVLSYLCAGRAILLAVPAANLAARIVVQNHAGLATEPDDVESFVRAAERLAADTVLRDALAARGREYALQTFHLEHVTDRFEEIFTKVAGKS